MEFIFIVLFLLCFYYLFNLNCYNEKLIFKLINVVILIGVGLLVIILGLIGYGNRYFDFIIKFY